MNWLKRMRPRIARAFTSKSDAPNNLWAKCPSCEALHFHQDWEKALYVCPGCQHHRRLTATQRLQFLFDDGAFETIACADVPTDPLKFRDSRAYRDRLRDARRKTGTRDATMIGFGQLEGAAVTIAAQDFGFMGGSLGMAAGEAFISGARHAVKHRCPYIAVTAAGGARMQEGILSLMQMPRTIVAVQELRAMKLPYLVVLTDPTTGGVTASYGMLGDVHLAEPGALIGFAGPRVIEQTIKEQLPPNFQRAEYLLEHGIVDMVVHRRDLRAMLARLTRLLMPARAACERPQDTAKAAPEKAATPIADATANGAADGAANTTADEPADMPADISAASAAKNAR